MRNSAVSRESARDLTLIVFRFVGGAINKNEGGVTVKAPSATIGIRGAIGLLSVDAATKAVQGALVGAPRSRR